MRGAVNAPKHGESSGKTGGRYDPNQPRLPAGHPGGGRWTDEAASNVARGINDPRVISDVVPDNLWIPGADYALGTIGSRETIISGSLFPGK
jgi:hypothetical protein